MASARSATASPRRQTAAPRRQPRAPERPRPRPRRVSAPRPRLRVRWDRVGRVTLLVVLVIVMGLYVKQAIAYLSVRSQANQQNAIERRLERENAQLARQQKALNNPATIVEAARALGMVRPGERPYVITGLANR